MSLYQAKSGAAAYFDTGTIKLFDESTGYTDTITRSQGLATSVIRTNKKEGYRQELIYGKHRKVWKNGKLENLEMFHPDTRTRNHGRYFGYVQLNDVRHQVNALFSSGKVLSCKFTNVQTKKVSFKAKGSDKVLRFKTDKDTVIELTFQKKPNLKALFDYYSSVQIKLYLDAELRPTLSSPFHRESYQLKVFEKDTLIAFATVERNRLNGEVLVYGKIFHFVKGCCLTDTEFKRSISDIDFNKDIVKETNSQKRMFYIEKFGVETFFEHFKKEMALISKEDGAELYGINTTMSMLKVVCPSTQRAYILRVPGRFESAKEARYWTLRINTMDVKFELET